MKEKLVIIDTDCGVDDSIALIIALKERSIRILGITTSFGNVSADQAARNVLSLIDLVDPGYHIPVFKGEETPLDGRIVETDPLIHGRTGRGYAVLKEGRGSVEKESAASFIARTLKDMPGEVTLLTLGRLTNIARALERDARLADHARELILMGGSAFVPGNVSPCSEANIAGDSQSADMVFSAFGRKLTMIGLDVTTQLRLTGDMVRSLESLQDDATRPIYTYFKDALRLYFEFYRRVDDTVESCPVHDPLAMLYLIDPSLCAIRSYCTKVIVSKDVTNGFTLVDRRVHPSVGNQVNIAVEVDKNRGLNKLLSYFRK